jgi:SAM-dependent methyltransferase
VSCLQIRNLRDINWTARAIEVSQMSSREKLKVPRKMWYEYFATQFGKTEMYFMNYGYNYPDGLSRPEMLDEVEEKFRFQNQLYHHVLGGINLENRDVLEVGCGGGAGSLYLTRHFNPRSLTGLDLATDANSMLQQSAFIPESSLPCRRCGKAPIY